MSVLSKLNGVNMLRATVLSVALKRMPVDARTVECL
jgi:hypothetical protein